MDDRKPIPYSINCPEIACSGKKKEKREKKQNNQLTKAIGVD